MATGSKAGRAILKPRRARLRRVPLLLGWLPFLWAAIATAAFVSAAANGWAVIRVNVPVTHIYDVAKLVLVGKTVRLDPQEKVVEVEIVGVPKGDFAGGKVLIRLGGASDYFTRIEMNQPVVIFNGLRGALVHLADNFLSAEPLAQGEPPVLKVNKVNPIQSYFPGRTPALVGLVNEIALGNPTLLNLIEHVVWAGGIRELGNVLAKADYVTAADLNGDGRAEVLIGNAKTAQLLMNTGPGFKDRTRQWGLQNARGKWAAFGDVNGDKRPDILIGNRLWLNKGDHFAAGLVLPVRDEASVLTVALMDCTGAGRPDAMFLMKNGDLQVFENPGIAGAQWRELPTRHLWSGGEDAAAAALSNDWGDTGKPHAMVVRASGVTRYALDPDGGAPAQFDRLTSESLDIYNEMEGIARWGVIATVGLDINGDGRADLLVILDKGGPNLVNRGFGTFFLNPLPAQGVFTAYDRDEVPWKVTPGTRFGAGDIHGDKFDDLLIVTPEGRLFELNNTPYERMQNRFQ